MSDGFESQLPDSSDADPIVAELIQDTLEPSSQLRAETDESPHSSEELDPLADKESIGIQNRLAVLALLFLVTGALGLPLLWINRRFSNAERFFWAALVTAYTIGLIWIVFRICMWSYQLIQGL